MSTKEFDLKIIELTQLHLSGKSASDSTLKHLEEIKSFIDNDTSSIQKLKL